MQDGDLRFLSPHHVRIIHDDQLDRYGGSAGIRDEGLLQSACAQPLASFGGEFAHVTPAAIAAAYLFHIVRNHPFIDGNKRAGAATALVFLKLNGIKFTIAPGELFDITMGVASGTNSKDDTIAFFERRVMN
jgi:death-on-curing protein